MNFQGALCPLKPDASTCGYCGPPGQRSKRRTNVHAAELIPYQFTDLPFTCQAYQMMIDRGWRRSGTYCYKPDLQRSCCPQYTIRLDALEFKTSKSQRKLVNRFNRWVLQGDDKDDKGVAKKAAKASNDEGFSLTDAIHKSEATFASSSQTGTPAHRFEVTIEPSSFTAEKFALYQRYQRDIHHEKVDKQPSGFKRFLVENPLGRERIPYTHEPPAHLPREYGAYHQLYRLDGELIAVGVIDILPNCVSSVYFMYDKKWERFSLGKLSALREITLAKEMHDAGAPGMQYLYMGFYIQSCPKMRYKGEYSPSYLLDPEEYSWHPLDECKPLLSKYRYACFAHPEHSIEGAFIAPGDDDATFDVTALSGVLLLTTVGGRLTARPVVDTSEWRDENAKHAISSTVLGIGPELARLVFLYLAYPL